MKRIGIAGWLALLLASAALAQSGDADAPPEARRNWYNDPFIALSRDVAECPLPLGPWMTRAEMTDDAHYRAERGTTCWLAHRCTKPNSYMYDAPIADAVKAHFAGSDRLHGTSLWITVQRRFIYVEGCADTAFDRQALQRELEAIPDVEQVFVRITDDPRKRLPYKARGQPGRTPD
ncbi:BON domain-containing protein [Burkholderia cepacia]|uniref:BON domain-containing protein n=1 Tax=Burkholderia cepacia TaxID=292 RepID=UPI002AB60EEB|nr:BON domain-containing protein [Burkholderia cepacia]